MRGSFFALLLTAACGGVHVDPTMNQPNPLDNGYPAGPYGYAQDSVIANLKFVAKLDPAGAAGSATYDQLALKSVELNDFHKDPAVRYVFLSGVAGWCGPCNAEQPGVKAAQAKYEPMGVRILEAMIEGYKLGTAATELDLNRWQYAHTLHVALALDPNDFVHQYADIAAFPLNMMIRTSDMKIVAMQVGEVTADTFISSNLR